MNDAQIEAAASTYARLAKVTRAPYPTRQHLGNALVDVYASPDAEAAYRAIDFGAAPTGAPPLPVGALVVKAMYDDRGAPSVLTVMYKKAKGYDPKGGDWWYGRLGLDGSPTAPAYVGKVDFCVACHAGARATDFVWGVDRAYK
jgi:hypothetical protein